MPYYKDSYENTLTGAKEAWKRIVEEVFGTYSFKKEFSHKKFKSYKAQRLSALDYLSRRRFGYHGEPTLKIQRETIELNAALVRLNFNLDNYMIKTIKICKKFHMFSFPEEDSILALWILDKVTFKFDPLDENGIIICRMARGWPGKVW